MFKKGLRTWIAQKQKQLDRKEVPCFSTRGGRSQLASFSHSQ